MNSRSISFGISALIHLTVILLGTYLLVSPPRYAVKKGRDSVEVSLVAAETQSELPPSLPPPTPLTQSESPKPESKPVKASKDTMTAHTDSGATTDVVPDYDRNPPPVYPEDARLHKQQGTVLLEVNVTKQGRAGAISVSKSSGYSSLDAAAVKVVRSWRFQPATVGGIKIQSSVLIPVQFQLNK